MHIYKLDGITTLDNALVFALSLGIVCNHWFFAHCLVSVSWVNPSIHLFLTRPSLFLFHPSVFLYFILPIISPPFALYHPSFHPILVSPFFLSSASSLAFFCPYCDVYCELVAESGSAGIFTGACHRQAAVKTTRTQAICRTIEAGVIIETCLCRRTRRSHPASPVPIGVFTIGPLRSCPLFEL